MTPRKRDEIADFPGFRIQAEGETGECEAPDNTKRLEQGEPMLSEPHEEYHARQYTSHDHGEQEWRNCLKRIRDLALRENERFPGNPHNPLVRSARSVLRQVGGELRQVSSDYCEIT